MSTELKGEIDELIKQLNDLTQNKVFPAKLSEYSDKYPGIRQLAEDLLALREFSYALSEGDLSQKINLRGYWSGLLKTLQSNLRHLTWQTGMLASGDYSQRVDFMGDFSSSFNSMIIRLKDATEKEQKYIAALEKNQAIIKESEQKYRLIAENTDDVIWFLDNKMIVRYISPSIERLLGFTVAEFKEKPVTQTPLPYLQDVFRKAIDVFMENDSAPLSFLIEWEQLSKNRNMIWLESSVSVARNSDGDIIGFIGVTRNISARKKAESLLQHTYERHKQRDFFNQLATRNDCNYSEVQDSGWQNKIYIPENFSLYFLALDNIDILSKNEDNIYRKQQITDALVDHVNRKKNTIAWETTKGVGIISPVSLAASRKDKELDIADDYIKYVSTYLPDLPVNIGIANYIDGWSNFANRLKNAETSVQIGKQVWPDKKKYHYEDCGVYRVLAPFALTDEAAAFVTQMIGPLMEYPDLIETLEKILAGLSFKEIGAQMHFHHKTIQLRKQRIEQILNVSLDSYETRLNLATALNLMKVLNH
ncbi:MAG TPA: PAS domain S-box protein [Methylomusa anaerophila]|uniref:Carbohydrate diacid transcriptional activator CdaR n=1 Tax=Methylomusa anaerophila TaxID=1930071 RepID=A0A348AIM2_9FIRM|nr:PAS domain S-box protein [Methylomusa anaerophila]BBB90920.1 carbohydrate diacid transcriptional activator CdaR [Methylomusa anaerophila]HML90677.1 PAS domain S-box protein [Methylomusa anaerophila]